MPDASDIADQSYSAALEEAEDRDFGTSQEDITAYAEVAGTVAGAAACTAVGAGAAAPLCGYIAGELAGWISNTIGGWFSDNEEAEAARQRRIDIAAHFAQWRWATEIDRELGAEFQRYLDQINALHAELWPGARWEGLDPEHPQAEWQQAMLLLDVNGAPLESSRGQYVVLGLESMGQLWQDLQARGISDAAKKTWIEDRADAVYRDLQLAYNATVLQLTIQKAAARGLSDAQNMQGRSAVEARFSAMYAAQREQTRTALEVHEQTRDAPYIRSNDRSWGAAGWRLGVALGAGALVGLGAWKVLS